tara:strand:+ start:24760 stop:25185 length:426 start_codon:yes stop_codon:yes gene_type:complete
MKHFSKVITIALFIFSVAFISCDDNEEDDCSTVLCTEQFVTITVSITNQGQNPVALDRIEVINLQNQSDVTIPLSSSTFLLAQQQGQYPIVNDSGIGKNQELILQFKGFVNGVEVVNENYVVAADCCHVSLVSGNQEVILE